MLWASIVSVLAGAGRWINTEAGKALAATGLAVVLAGIVVAAGVAMFGVVTSGAESRVNWRWLQQITELNRKAAAARAEKEERMRLAVESERDTALVALRDEIDARVRLEREIAALKENRVILSREERRRLFKQ